MLGELRDMLFGFTGPRGGKPKGLLKKAVARAGADFGAAPKLVHPAVRGLRSAGMTTFARHDPPDRGLSAAVALPASMPPLRLVARPHATVPTASTPTDAADAAGEQRNRRLGPCCWPKPPGSAKVFEVFEVFDETPCGMAQAVARRIVAVGAVEDVLVESYFQAWQQAARSDAERGSGASWLLAAGCWLLAILRAGRWTCCAASECAPLRRSTRKTPTSPRTNAQAPRRCWPSPGATARLHASLGKLSAQERCLLGLAFFCDPSHGQIAETTGVPLGTVNSAILRAQAKLRRDLAAAVAEEASCQRNHPRTTRGSTQRRSIRCCRHRPMPHPTPIRARAGAHLMRRIAQEQQHHTVQAAAGNWKDFSPGVQIKVLHRAGELMPYLLRFAPGAFVGAHRHRSDESCIVLEGTLLIGDDLVLPAGGLHLAVAGTVHARIGSDEGAPICLHGSAPQTADLI